MANNEPRLLKKANHLRLRAQVIQAVRQFFVNQDFLEIDTPVRIPAPIPEAHIEVQPAGDWVLQPSPEVCMKRVMAAGFPRIFQICKCFRPGERGGRHLPEFTLLEWYGAGLDYMDMMDQTEALIRFVVRQIGIENRMVYGGKEIDLGSPWPRLRVEAAFEMFSDIPMPRALADGSFDTIMGCDIEPHLGTDRPVFLHDYPISRGALAKRRDDRPEEAERFELYIAGLELCNAFSELTDPMEQRERFRQELGIRRSQGKSLYPMPEKFLGALKTMPDAAGNALGLDRLVMLLADTEKIDDVVAFSPESL